MLDVAAGASRSSPLLLESLMPSKEFILYCDESESSGRFFSDFYGGVLVGSSNLDKVRERIAQKKAELNFYGEVKWTKITENYADKYIEMIDLIFDLLREKKIKIRIMFTQNMYRANNLTQEHKDNKYLILYYQFIKFAFGLMYVTRKIGDYNVRVYLDKMPDTAAKIDRFRQYVADLSNTSAFRDASIVILKENVTEVRSHEHDLLQCLDIILGAMNFRLNDLHKEKPPGKHRRGKRTVAKERVYKHINRRICELYPNFNVGKSTGTPAILDRWRHPYRHWCFRSRDFEIVENGSKRKKTP